MKGLTSSTSKLPEAQTSPWPVTETPEDAVRPTSQTQDNAQSWAPYFNETQYESFISLVLMYFEEKGIDVVIEDGSAVVQGEEEMQFGLTNIAQVCFQSEPLEWGKLIEKHFDNLLGLLESEDELPEFIDDYEQAEKLLAVRIYHEDWIEDLEEGYLIYRRDLEGTISVLVFDLPTSIRNVTPGEAEAWGKTHEELMAQALENTYNNYPQPGAFKQLSDDFGIWIFSDGSFFVATHALFLDEYEQCIGEYGSLFGIPIRDGLLCYPIEDIGVVEATESLVYIIAGIELEGPGSVSPNLFWYYEGEMVNLPYSLTEDRLEFFPPDSFVDVLDQIAENSD